MGHKVPIRSVDLAVFFSHNNIIINCIINILCAKAVHLLVLVCFDIFLRYSYNLIFIRFELTFQPHIYPEKHFSSIIIYLVSKHQHCQLYYTVKAVTLQTATVRFRRCLVSVRIIVPTQLLQRWHVYYLLLLYRYT